MAEALVVFAAVLLVPLGLALIGAPRWIRLAQLPAALCLAASFAFPKGPAAAGLAAPWALVTLAVAFHGIARLAARRTFEAGELGVDAACGFLLVGGAWALLSRAGVTAGYPSIIGLLTAVHFHYAGFVLPILAVLAHRRLRTRTSPLPVWGVIAGMPLIAVGITFSPLVEWLAAWMLALTSIVLAVNQVRLARPLLVVSGLSLLVGMSLAGVYALAHFLGRSWIGIPEMIPTHGILNGVGFCLCGLLGWGPVMRDA